MTQDYKSEDEVLGKAYDARLMKRLLKYVKPYKKYVLFAILLNMVVAVLGPIRPYLTKIAVDDHITNSNYNGLLEISLLLFGVTCFASCNSILPHLLHSVLLVRKQFLIFGCRYSVMFKILH